MRPASHVTPREEQDAGVMYFTRVTGSGTATDFPSIRTGIILSRSHVIRSSFRQFRGRAGAGHPARATEASYRIINLHCSMLQGFDACKMGCQACMRDGCLTRRVSVLACLAFGSGKRTQLVVCAH